MALAQRASEKAIAEAKGINFRGLLDVIEREHGKDARHRVIAECPPQLRDLLAYGGVSTSGWYSIEMYRELHAAAQRALRKGHDLARQIGFSTLKRDVSGVYRVLLFFLSPQSIITKAPRIMGQYWRGGTFVVSEAREGMAAARWEGWRGFDRNCWLDMIGGSEAAIDAAGGQNVRTRVVSGGRDGDDDLDLELRWTSR